jgi:hypothetical protein
VPHGSVPRLPVEVGSSAATCPVAPDLISLQGRAPMLPRVYGSGPCHIAGEGFKAATRPMAPDPAAPIGEGSSASMCPAVHYEPQISGIKKGALMCFQGAPAHFQGTLPCFQGTLARAIKPCKTCGQAAPLRPARHADTWLQCNTSPASHL